MTNTKLTPALIAANKARQARLDSGERIARLDPIEKASKNPTSLRLAINAKCFDCQGKDSDPGVRDRIGNCPCVKCPLHPVRPYQA
jgi:hypothetical protein